MAREKKKGFFVILSITVLVILTLAAIPYFYKFHGNLSENAEDWQVFSGYATAIFSFLAVVGAFFALYHTIDHSKDTTKLAEETKGLAKETNTLAKASNNKYIESEERSIFFRQLELFRDTTYKMHYLITSNPHEDAFGLKAIALFAHELRCSIISYYLFPHILADNREDLIQELIQSYNSQIKIRKEIAEKEGKDFHCPLQMIKYRIFVINEGKEPQNVITNHLGLLRNDTHYFITLISSIISTNIAKYENYVIYGLTKDFNAGKYHKIYRAYNYAGYTLYTAHEAELGNYFRNVYYCLQMIQEFDNTIPGNEKNKKTYNRIFRAQLTQYELAILFYNFIGSKSHIETMTGYESINIFTNLNLKDLLIHCHLYENERTKKESVINAMTIEHKKRLRSKSSKAYDTPPLYGELYTELMPDYYKCIDS